MEGNLPLSNNLEQIGASYGTFYLNSTTLLIILRPPFASEITLYCDTIKEELLLINWSQRKAYQVKIKNFSLIDLPYYFLGLKEKSLNFKKGKIYGTYQFSREELKGEVWSNLITFTWKIKEIEIIENQFPNLSLEDIELKSIEIHF
ncbi:MAG: hypothetical protein N2327_00035 [Caldimicrobium sp.]|nr:hypothetical protein [Caldimicrobium sp.]MCX7872816.1 hypothetical protein [Caldimicrobium sp.]MDW8093605.1 hypothetical protein [Caldimicrobium sp.]